MTRLVNDVTFPHKFQPIEINSLVFFFQLFLIGAVLVLLFLLPIH